MRTSIAALAALAVVGGAGFAFASTPRTYPGDEFSLRVDASGAIHREPYQVDRIGIAHAELPASPVVDVPPVAPVADAPLIESETDTDTAQPAAHPAPVPVGKECEIPAGAVSPSDKPELFPNRDGRFSKVPKYLVAFYERACEDYDVPVRYLVAQGSYETHFTPKKGDGGASCGIHQHHDKKRTWKGWYPEGGLSDCMNPEKNIRRAAQHLRELMDGKVYPKLGKRTMSQAMYHYNGRGTKAQSYSAKVMWGAETYYAN